MYKSSSKDTVTLQKSEKSIGLASSSDCVVKYFFLYEKSMLDFSFFPNLTELFCVNTQIT